MKTTNYYNTLIEVAEDCPAKTAEVPSPKAGKETAATMQFELIKQNPYTYTSDDVLFRVYAIKNGIGNQELDDERKKFFSKGQPCFRSSPLPKRYGWGVHSNEEGKIAIYAVESGDYKKLSSDQRLEHLKAMRSKRL